MVASCDLCENKFFNLLVKYRVSSVTPLMDFLKDKPEVLNILEEAYSIITEKIDEPVLDLSVGYFLDQETDRGIWVDIKTDLPEEQLESIKTDFDFDWWYPLQFKNKNTEYVNFTMSTLTRNFEKSISNMFT